LTILSSQELAFAEGGMYCKGSVPSHVVTLRVLMYIVSDSTPLPSAPCATSTIQLLSRSLTPEEVATFDTAIRIYLTKERTAVYNHQRLAELGSPVLRISAKHEGSGAASATSDEAENLSDTLHVCKGARVMLTKNLWGENGLVNGSMGTVRDIFWREGANTAVDQPYGIMVEFDGYTGPTWSPVSDAPGQESLCHHCT